jgi:hypothetical protein
MKVTDFAFGIVTVAPVEVMIVSFTSRCAVPDAPAKLPVPHGSEIGLSLVSGLPVNVTPPTGISHVYELTEVLAGVTAAVKVHLSSLVLVFAFWLTVHWLPVAPLFRSGVTVKSTVIGAAVTVNVNGLLVRPSFDAVMAAVPAATAVTTPVPETVAMLPVAGAHALVDVTFCVVLSLIVAVAVSCAV